MSPACLPHSPIVILKNPTVHWLALNTVKLKVMILCRLCFRVEYRLQLIGRLSFLHSTEMKKLCLANAVQYHLALGNRTWTSGGAVVMLVTCRTVGDLVAESISTPNRTRKSQPLALLKMLSTESFSVSRCLVSANETNDAGEGEKEARAWFR